MRFCCKVHYKVDIELLKQPVNSSCIANIHFSKMISIVIFDRNQVLKVSRIRKSVHIDNADILITL